MLCKNCGNNIKSDFKYCPYCGERIVSDFHDQFTDLTPPFVIRDTREDDAARFYAADPRETEPDFDREPPGARPEWDDPAEQDEPAYPDEPEYPGFVGEPDDGDGEAPYFVYRPEAGRIAPPSSAGAGRTSSFQYPGEPPGQEPPKPSGDVRISGRREKQKANGAGMGLKVFLIVFLLLLAAAVTIFGYQVYLMLRPFQNTGLTATFASVLLSGR